MDERLEGRKTIGTSGAEDGFTIVETMVALVILVVGIWGVVGMFTAATNSVGVAKNRNAVLAVADAHIELIRDMDYDDVALKSLPVHESDPEHPNSDVSGTTYKFDAEKDAEELVVDESNPNAIDPGPVAFEAGPIRGGVFRYVTEPEGERYKRITVVVRWTGPHQAPVRQAKVISVVVEDDK